MRVYYYNPEKLFPLLSYLSIQQFIPGTNFSDLGLD